MRISRLPLAALLFAIAACDRTTDPVDDGSCQQTYEFGNTGCFEVRGTVIDSTGRALSGISVVVNPLAPSSGFTTAVATTDTRGAFALRGARMVALKPPTVPDTITVRVHAADPRTGGVGVPATVRDSATTLVTIAPVGSVPNPMTIVITLRPR